MSTSYAITVTIYAPDATQVERPTNIRLPYYKYPLGYGRVQSVFVRNCASLEGRYASFGAA